MNPLAQELRLNSESLQLDELPAFPAGMLAPTKTVLLTADLLTLDPVEAKRQEIHNYFRQTSALYERLFDLIKDDASFYDRHEPLRHPLIFYYAHPAVFFINKLIAGRYISERIDSHMEAIMAVGVDEMSWDDLNTKHN